MSDDLTNSHAQTPAGRRSALDWVAETVGNDVLLQELHARARRRRRRRGVIVGGVVAALLLCFVVWRPVPRHAAESATSKPLQVSVPRQQVLPDGSRVELRDDARIEIDFSGSQRRVALLSGEAHFSVEKDPARPFIVRASGVEVRAVGTAFAVEMATRGVEVLVTEGRVAVDHAAATATASPEVTPLAFVAAGQGTIIEPAAAETPRPPPRVVAINEAAMAERLAWRVPRLELSGTPLADAVEAFNQHSKVKLVIGDPSLARVQVSGIVRADQADALVSLLASNFDVTAERQGSETVLLRRAR
jgi:transmembrane sensor